MAFRSSRAAVAPNSTTAAPLPFRAIGIPGATRSPMRVRASTDGLAWTEWHNVEPDGPAGALVYFDRTYNFVEADSPATLLFIDPGVTPAGVIRPRAAVSTPPI